MVTQLRRQRPTRAPIDVEADDGDYNYDDPPWDEDDDGADRSSRRNGSASRSRPDNERDERRESRPPSRDRERGRNRDEDRTASRGAGWDTLREQRAKKAAGNAHRLQVKDKEVIVKFLDAEPFAVYEQHWVGQRSYTCPEEGCPLCDGGYDTRTLALFNVINMVTCENMYWEAGPQAGKRILAASEKKSSSPINREDLYFAINRKKQSNGFFDYEMDAIKERDLEPDYGIDPLNQDELETSLEHLFDDSVIPVTSKRDLIDVARSDDDE
jgi:hypothetical protein